jgi:hypothetical protein
VVTTAHELQVPRDGENQASEPDPFPHARTPSHSLAALSARYGERYRWRVLMTVMIGSIASVMSSTIVNVAVPDLMHHLKIGQKRAQ